MPAAAGDAADPTPPQLRTSSNAISTRRAPIGCGLRTCTQFRTGEGWLHLAAVIDLWSRRVVDWAMGPTANAELVTNALVMAFERRRPDRRVVHHSDRGAAYTSLAFSQRVVELEVDQSFGSTGDCYDCDDAGALLRSA